MGATLLVGRATELGLLQKRLDNITRTGTGIAVSMRGRRQVGKSRLVQEFCDRAGLPYFSFTAVKGASSVEATTQFLAELVESALPRDRDLVPVGRPAGGWADIFPHSCRMSA